VSDAEYENLLRRKGSEKQYEELIAGNENLRTLITSKALSKEALKEIVAHASVITLCAADLLAPGLKQAEEEVKSLDKEFSLGLTTEGDRALQEAAVLQASYRTAAIPGLITNFFKNYRENPDYWGPLFDGHVQSARLYKKEAKQAKKGKEIVRRVAHDRVAHAVGSDLINELVGNRKNVQSYRQKLDRFQKLGGLYGAKSRAVVEEKIASLEHAAAQVRKKALEKLEKVIVARPGILHGQIPTLKQGHDVVLSAPATAEELQLATSLLNEIVEME